MTPRARVIAALVGAVVVALTVAIVVGPVTRTPGFHAYADRRGWLGLPNAGDVLSNLAFVVVAALAARRLRAPTVAAPRRLAIAAVVAVALVGVGSGVYHVAPADAALAFDWAPIVIALVMLTACVVGDRGGVALGRGVALVGVPLAVGVVAIWWAGGGTRGGDMRWYVAMQGTAVLLPLGVALIAPGRIARLPLVAALAAFVVARSFTARDAWWLAQVGVSGHALKHVAAAFAAGLALFAVTAPPRRGAPN